MKMMTSLKKQQKNSLKKMMKNLQMLEIQQKMMRTKKIQQILKMRI